ncbi:hypothetical protein BGK67_01370 [Streptomyces subrutilus]|uniref:Uncharacterized protein n=1 Tax=Streptomyces subrutilus TaxID=36818 RepID=A0A1E5PKY6_9ACTN|nr:hypothetical protein BGK67_01370 [Streptomyces subrutilus]
MFGELAGGVGVRRNRAADGAEAAGRIVAAEDEELRVCEGAGDGADDRFGGLSASCRGYQHRTRLAALEDAERWR